MNQDRVETQTPEEKEALDLIDTTPHQYEMSKFSGKKEVEWACVEGLTYKQVDFSDTIETIDGDICIDSDLYFAWSNKNIVHISDVSAKDLLMNRHKLCKLTETPQQREERENIESAYELYRTYQLTNNLNAMSFDAFKSNRGSEKLDGFLAIVDKTKYRKEVD